MTSSNRASATYAFTLGRRSVGHGPQLWRFTNGSTILARRVNPMLGEGLLPRSDLRADSGDDVCGDSRGCRWITP